MRVEIKVVVLPGSLTLHTPKCTIICIFGFNENHYKHFLEAFAVWKKMEEPDWPHLQYKKPNYQAISYYSAPKQKKQLNSLDEVDPEMRKTMDKLGISMEEQKRLSGVAVDFVMDSVSVATSFKEKLGELGIIFCSMSDAVKEHPELIKKYLGSVVPTKDNFFLKTRSALQDTMTLFYITRNICFNNNIEFYLPRLVEMLSDLLEVERCSIFLYDGVKD
mgnify:CR=1 FL=1